MTGRHSKDRNVPHVSSCAQPTLRLRVHRPARHRAQPGLIARLAWPQEDTARLLRVVRR